MRKASIQYLQILALLLSGQISSVQAAEERVVRGSELSLEEQERQLFYQSEGQFIRKEPLTTSKDRERLTYDRAWKNQFLYPPSESPTSAPSISYSPTKRPSESPSESPSVSSVPTEEPSTTPSQKPTQRPTPNPTRNPTPNPTRNPTARPTPNPTPRSTPRPTPPPARMGVSYVPGKLTVSQNGLILSEGLNSRIIARTNERVRYANGSKSSDRFHGEPDGAAVVPDNDGGWIYVSNSEMNGGGGGVGAIYFDRNGEVVNYKMLLRGTSRNCSGGKTPWNTWVSCEEHGGGKIWQVDPTGRRVPQVTSLSPGTGDFESFAYDIRNMNKPRFFVTEDNNRGALRRFTPSNPNWNDPWNILHGRGTLEYLVLAPRDGTDRREGTYYWTTDLDHARRSAEAFYHHSEGLDVYRHELFFTSKDLKSLFILNLDGNTYRRFSTRRGLFDGQPDQMQRIIDDSQGLLYFCEEGEREGIHARDRQGWFFTILESTMDTRETTGLAFSPDGKHMYFSYQMKGIIFDVWREDGQPFHGRTLDVHYHQQG